MTFTEQFQSITTLIELYQFRDELIKIASEKSSISSKEIDWDNIKLCQNANFYLNQVETRITQLGEEGIWLDQIQSKK